MRPLPPLASDYPLNFVADYNNLEGAGAAAAGAAAAAAVAAANFAAAGVRVSFG